MAETQWYYLEEGQQKGPVTEKQLLELVLKRILQPSTKVWCPTATQGWEPVGNITKFRKQMELAALLPKDKDAKAEKYRSFAPAAGKVKADAGIWADKEQVGTISTQNKPINILNWLVLTLLAGAVAAAIFFRPQLEHAFPHQFAQIYFQSGSARCLSGDSEAAISDFSQAVKLDPKLKEAYFHKGAAEIKTGDTRDAWSDIQQSVKIDAKFAPGYYGIAYLAADTGDYKVAIEQLDKALVLDPHFANAYYGRGLMRSEMGNGAGAMVDLKAAAASFSEHKMSSQAEKANSVIDTIKKADEIIHSGASPDQPPPQPPKWVEKDKCIAHDLAL